jgi:hypothetical protein
VRIVALVHVSTPPEEEIKTWMTKAEVLHFIDSPLLKLFLHSLLFAHAVPNRASSSHPLGTVLQNYFANFATTKK